MHNKRLQAFLQFQIFIVALLFFFEHSYSQTQATAIPPRPSGPVADYAQLLDSETSQVITNLAQNLWDKAQFGLVVVTLPSLENITIEEYANKLYSSWGIGKKGTDEGALLLLCLNPRKARIEVGYGSEGYINDAKAGRLLDAYGIPFFKQGAYSKGMLAMSSVITEIVSKEKNIQIQSPVVQVPKSQQKQKQVPFQIVFLAMAIFVFVSRFINNQFFPNRTYRHQPNWFGGGFGSGGSGGGFHGGFGGGGGGGGGASRGF